jgi:ergothioneine biosynthesis protein EgtB
MLKTQDSVESLRSLLSRLQQARQSTDEIFSLVRPEFLRERPIAERHRLLFYLGHLEAFDWNLLHSRILNLNSFHPAFDRLFAFGIDPVGGGLPDDQPGDWPALEEIHRYNLQARQALDRALVGLPPDVSQFFPGTDFSISRLLNTAIEHRLMHAETLAYLFHRLPPEAFRPTSSPAIPDGPSPVSKMVPIPEGTVQLGLPEETETFGWDNEKGIKRLLVSAFRMDSFQVTNGQYLEFMEAGGYDDRGLWEAADWDWRAAQGIQHPALWKKAEGKWNYRRFSSEGPLPLNWPVYVSQAEAAAYARWKGLRLPTEAEWHRAAYGTPEGVERDYPWGGQAPGPERGNFDFQNWDPVPVDRYPEGRSAFGIWGLLGNGWEWTSDVFEPFPGFHPASFYPGYSADFFDGKHFVMKGGSARTAACLLRRSFRNWFQPHYPYGYAGFRCVESGE